MQKVEYKQISGNLTGFSNDFMLVAQTENGKLFDIFAVQLTPVTDPL